MESSFPFGPGRKPWRETLSALVTTLEDERKPTVSAPRSDPLLHDITPVGITPALYQVPSTGLSREEHERAMKETVATVEKCRGSFLGYQCNQSFDAPEFFQSPISNVMMNNGGDPFLPGNNRLSFRPKWMECGVLNFYASLWNAKWPHDPSDPDSYWGYVLTMGSTEGNIHALWSARNYLSGRYECDVINNEKSETPTAPSKAPVVFYSKNSNFSLIQLCNLVNISTFDAIGNDLYPGDNPLGGKWMPGVPCEGGDAGPGTIDISALEKLVDFFSGRGHPIVVVFSYGTTFKGSCDDVECAGAKLVSILKKNKMYERVHVSCDDSSKRKTCKGFWFHVDGALSAAYMPFLEMAYKNGLTDIQPASIFDFRLGFVSSIVMSGHKFIGIPWPCGVYLVRCLEQILTFRDPFFKTLGVSRNGHSAVLLWSFISSNSYEAQVATILKCLHVVKYTVEQLRELQLKLNKDLWITNNSPSLSVVFRQPNAIIVEKYTLSCKTVYIDSHPRHVSQIFIMPHVTTDKIDIFIKDLCVPGAFEE